MSATQIELHNAPSSPQLARRLKEKCERLERIHPDVRYCRVSVEGPDAASPGLAYRVALRVSIPGAVVAPEPELHVQVNVAVNRAFAEVRRRLLELAPKPVRSTPGHAGAPARGTTPG